MEWLNDKKNQPIVAAVAIVIIVGVVFGAWWMFIRKPAPPADTSAGMPDQTATAPDSSAAGTQPAPTVGPGGQEMGSGTPAPTATSTGQPGTPTAATGQVTSAARTPGTQVASITPMETWRADPFQPIGYKPPPDHKITPPIRDFPFEQLFRHQRKPVDGPVAEIQQPSRRMAGILLGNRVYAIIETNGATQVVKPGDYTTDRLAIVERIEPDRVVLKTVDKRPRTVTVRMAASPTVQSPSAPSMPGAPGPSNYAPPGGAPPPPPGMGGPPGGRPGEMP